MGKEVSEFADTAKRLLNPFMSSLTQSWPPTFDLTKADTAKRTQVQALLYFLARLVQKAASPKLALDFIVEECVNLKWHDWPSAKCPSIAIIAPPDEAGVWRVRDWQKFVSRYEAGEMKMKRKAKAFAEVEVRGRKMLKIVYTDTSEEIVPNEPPLKEWNEPDIPFVRQWKRLGDVPGPLPADIREAIIDCIASEDTALVRATLPSGVIPQDPEVGVPLLSALVDIFQERKRMPHLVLAVLCLEFGREELTPATVMRSNTNVTNFVKVFMSRFARDYGVQVLREISDFIRRSGDVGLKQPKACDPAKVEPLIFGVLELIFASEEKVPQEVRYFAAVIRTMAEYRFHDRQAAFNAVSGLFFLRFVAATLVDPHPFNGAWDLGEVDVLKLYAPVVRVLQSVFNLVDLGESLGPLQVFNERIRKEIWPKIRSFTFNITECRGQPSFAGSPGGDLDVAVKAVAKTLAEYWKQCKPSYRQLTRHGRERISPAACCLYGYLVGLFEPS